MQIFVKTIGGTTRTLELAPSSSIASLRELLEAKDADSVDSRILFGGKQLEGGTLEEYGVGREATLHLVGSLAGGFGADVLAEMLKKAPGMLGGLSRGSKFGGLDIKRVYFGNWLRDYSQAMDCASLSKIPKQTVLNLCMGLGFLAHGYATGEFEVTDERLGVYSCVEHIDNPKGYAADQPGGDARHLDPRLRGPVDPRELEIDPKTGMKNYIANENGTWQTSSRLVRERINQCIVTGRRGKHSGNEKDIYEAYRLLGTLLHTLEDFSAHSNWCELSLRRLGYSNVFCHVGDSVVIQTPAGPAPPLVTGTFGGSDFIHSLLGEASDHISEASISDLSKAMDGARSVERSGGSATDSLRDMLFNLPGSTGSELTREMEGVDQIKARAQAGDASTMSPQELHAQLWQVLTFRDNVVKGIENTIEKIPGLSSLVEKITDSINRFVFTTLEPLLKPIMGQATTALQTGSAQVINNNDQFEVFDNAQSSDPTHSFLSKDHFVLTLNEPAGMIACVVLRHTVKLIVDAWEKDSIDPQQVATKALEALHHPYFFDNNSQIQREMGACLKAWIDGQTHDEKQFILNGLTKQSVRAGKNKRRGHEADQIGHGCGGEYNSILSPEKVSAFAQQHVPGASGVMNTFNQASNTWNKAQGYMGQSQSGGRRREGDADDFSSTPPPAVPHLSSGYNAGYSEPSSSRYDNQSSGYGAPQGGGYGGHQQNEGYGGHQQQQHQGHGGPPHGRREGQHQPQHGGYGHDEGNAGFPGAHHGGPHHPGPDYGGQPPFGQPQYGGQGGYEQPPGGFGGGFPGGPPPPPPPGQWGGNQGYGGPPQGYNQGGGYYQ